MKKSVAIILAVILFSVNCSALGKTVVSKSSLCAGESFTVTVTLTSEKGFDTSEFTLEYDGQAVEYVSAKNSNKISEGVVKSVLLSDGTSVTNTFTFRALKKGTTEIKLTNIYESDGKSEWSDTGDSVSVSIVPPTKGDVNGDESVDAKDLSRLKKYLSNNSTEIVFSQADLNGDSSVNAKDLTRMKKVMAGIISLYS